MKGSQGESSGVCTTKKDHGRHEKIPFNGLRKIMRLSSKDIKVMFKTLKRSRGKMLKVVYDSSKAEGNRGSIIF